MNFSIIATIVTAAIMIYSIYLDRKINRLTTRPKHHRTDTALPHGFFFDFHTTNGIIHLFQEGQVTILWTGAGIFSRASGFNFFLDNIDAGDHASLINRGDDEATLTCNAKNGTWTYKRDAGKAKECRGYTPPLTVTHEAPHRSAKEKWEAAHKQWPLTQDQIDAAKDRMRGKQV